MDKQYLIVDRYTGEIRQEFRTEKDVTMYIRNIVLPSFPQYLMEMDVHVATIKYCLSIGFPFSP